jgi:hypothetical protein
MNLTSSRRPERVNRKRVREARENLVLAALGVLREFYATGKASAEEKVAREQVVKALKGALRHK